MIKKKNTSLSQKERSLRNSESQQIFADFYSRQIVMKELGRKGQRKLSHSKVAIVGLGGLGTVSSLYLALAGVGHLRLVDQDIVDLQNLHRQILYTAKDIDSPKVEVAGKRLRESNSLIDVETVPENLNADNAKDLLHGVDCVVDGLDNMRTRYLVNRACVKLGIPYVFGAGVGVEGELSVFDPREADAPCLECVLPNVEDNYLMSCETRGVLGATVGVIGSLEAIEALKVLTGFGSPLRGKLMICDFNDMYFAVVDVFKRAACPVCGETRSVARSSDRLVWLCGRNMVNVNPERTLNTDLRKVCEVISGKFNVRVKSRLALVFDFKGYEISLFNTGRMLIKNVHDEQTAIRVYHDVVELLGLSQ